jgi:FlaA1/EpsC-like NDP-sugar epimerase
MMWATGLSLAAWSTHGVSAGGIRVLPLSCSILVIGAMSVLAGLMAGLYRGRWQRGSLDEVASVSFAAVVMLALLLMAYGPLASGPLKATSVLVTGTGTLTQTVIGGALIAVPTLTAARYLRSAISQRHRTLAAAGVEPTVNELLSGSALIKGVRDFRTTDLLGRLPVRTDVASIAGHFAGKRVLVTGAGGSIGSQLCRQLHKFGPAELIMLDRDESALHEVQLSLHGRALLDSDETVLADIRDERRIREVFERFRPQIVFHAAALKHLPLLERYPVEAVKSNILGTQTVLTCAAAFGAESFVNISTDKAADPVSVLGYSKRITERLTAHMAGTASGSYLSVRFGNVLGSRGSVLLALSAQVTAGGPLTVTHPEVTRYFMTADEAVQLVLQAAVVGSTGEVLILDMGEPVRIADIARRLSAYSARPVEIVYTGLRPGEKLAEDLLGPGEVGYRRHHPLVRHARVVPLDPRHLARLVLDGDEASLRKSLADCATGTAELAGVVSAQPRARTASTGQPAHG